LVIRQPKQACWDHHTDPKWLGAEPAITAILHTWDQRLRAHRHVHWVMPLPAEDFIHPFLLHVLPKGFQRIRHYGLLANRHKAVCLAQARAVLNLPPPEPVLKETVEDFARRVLGVDILRCPVCHEGRMRLVETLPRSTGPPGHV